MSGGVIQEYDHNHDVIMMINGREAECSLNEMRIKQDDIRL